MDGRIQLDLNFPELFTDRFCSFQKSKTTQFVIPAKAGIQFFSGCLDSRICGNDELSRLALENGKTYR